MKSKNPIDLIKDKFASDIMTLDYQINHIKQLFRQGWLRYLPEEKVESVGDHIWAMTLLAMILADRYFPHLNIEKVLRMTILHDVVELYPGDLTPHMGVSPPRKSELERETILKLFKNFPGGKKYIELWEEYESKESPEAKFVNQIDKLEMAFQASVYEHQHDVDLQEFFDYTELKLSDKELKQLFNELNALRPKYTDAPEYSGRTV